MRHTRHPFRAIIRRRRLASTARDAGQAALVMVIAITVALTTVGGVMVSAIATNDPILTQASIQRLAYRALSSGLNAYQSQINADPYLAACNSTTNVGQSNANTQCSGISYETWSQVPSTNTGNGIIPEYYMYDNPYAVVNSSTNALTYLDVQIVGAAGYGSNVVYYSTVAKFTPANGFLDNVWWSNFESYNSAADTNPTTTGSATGCKWYYATNYNNSGSCSPVYFGPNDSVTGPVFSNDSIFVDSKPNFGAGYSVTTPDPSCLFVDPLDSNHGSPPGCANATSDVGTYDAATSTNSSSNYEPIPTDNSELANFAQQDGCYYVGPTTVTLYGNQMTVLSPGTSSTGANDSLNFSSNANICPTDGSTKVSLPANGVLFVDQGGNNNPNNNPFDGVPVQTCVTKNGKKTCTTTVIDNQTSVGTTGDQSCSGCYYGQTSSPDSEGDAFVSGSVSGHLTVGAANDVVITGPLTYADCTWAGTQSQSNCNYNSFTSSTATNDVLGLIAYQYVEVNMPVDDSGNILPACGSSASNAEPAPLCDPSTSSGNPGGGQGLQIDASILALQGSFIVNNYGTSNSYTAKGNEGYLSVYGSIQQDARGPVGTFNGNNSVSGYIKRYLWDPRLPFYSPPYYLTPGTPSWSLTSSAESYTGLCPALPPAQSTPTTSQPSFTNPGTWSACTVP